MWKDTVPLGGIQTDIVGWHSDVYTVSSGDRLACRDLRSGAVKWRFQSGHRGQPRWWSEAPAAIAGKVFFGGLDGTLYALDATSGRLIWNHEMGARISTSVTALGGTLYFGTASGHIYRVGADDGKVLADLKIEPTPVSAPAVTNDPLLYFLDAGGGAGTITGESLVCIDRSLGAVRWKHISSSWDSNRPYVWRGEVLVGGAGGKVTAFQVGDGAQQWSYRFRGVIKSISGDGRSLYVGAQAGVVYEFRP